MIELKFPDGAARQFEAGATGRDVAASISPSLAKRALLVKLDGQLLDLDRPLEAGGAIQIVTRMAAADGTALSMASLLAAPTVAELARLQEPAAATVTAADDHAGSLHRTVLAGGDSAHPRDLHEPHCLVDGADFPG